MKKQSVLQTGITVGSHIHYHQCRFCHNSPLIPFIDFGYVPLAGGFFPKSVANKDFINEQLYPLQICVCPTCYLVQCNTIVSRDALFHSYYYFSSVIPTLINHFTTFAEELRRSVVKPSKTFIVELGCNDGVFLTPLRALGFKTLGVDPATNVVKPLIRKGFNIINDYFSECVAENVTKTYGQADIIVSSNSFAHIDDMDDIMRGIKRLLKKNGVFIFETHYLGDLLKHFQYDMMYHEHHSYYSLTSLEPYVRSFDLEIVDVKRIPIHAGSMRYYVRHIAHASKVNASVKALKKEEKQKGMDTIHAYFQFYKTIDKRRRDLQNLIAKIKSSGKTIAGYGASGRATIMMSFCSITKNDIPYVIDDAPAKIGAFTPGNHLPITSSSILYKPKRPDYVILFAWSFADDIIKQHTNYLASGGKFIIPLPHVSIVDKSYGSSQ
ncbi:MAG: class I SAM-dependent methyltransferase [Candidatus Gottesmanbacteria bacterium]